MASPRRKQVRDRAGDCCEYCQLPQLGYDFSFHIDHVIARQHGGRTEAENLALACASCNRHKGPNIAGVDPVTRKLSALFHPRRERWQDHFEWQGLKAIGKTPTGRVTVQVLSMNNRDWINIRRALFAEGLFPPNL